jgi:Bacteriophage HK97-gp10, putative tail-component
VTVAELAAKLREAAARAETELAKPLVTEMSRSYLAILRARTPVRSGRLRDSEYPDFIAGGGTHAEAVVSPHTVYAQFREDGGTITAKKPNKRGQLMLGTPAAGFFGREVTQAGAHYVEHSHLAALAVCDGIARAVLDEFMASTGLE